MARLPQIGGDQGNWGTVLNEFLQVSHNEDGTTKDGIINVKTYGAKGNGTTDDTAAIQAAINAAVTSKGTVYIPAGNYLVSSTVTVADGIHIEGTRGTKLIPPAGFNFSVFKLDNVKASISRLVIEKASGANAKGGGWAINVVGNADGCTFSDITVTGMHSGFHVAGAEGTVPGTVKRVTFDRCRSNNAVLFGFWLDDVDGVEIVSCQSVVTGLDGIKFRKKVLNAAIRGGYFTGATGGDGLDAYAGGDTFTIEGGTFSGNSINGITVKCDDLNKSDPSNYGYVRNLIITGVRANNNGGNGITCHRSSGSPDDANEPLVVRASIIGCIAYGNRNYGFYLQSRQVTLSGCHAAHNGLDGFYLESACLDVDLIGCHAAGNSVTTANTRDGFHISGNRVRVIGGSSIGTDPDGARSDTDLANGRKTQRFGLRVESGSTNITIHDIELKYNASSQLSDASNAAGGKSELVSPWGTRLQWGSGSPQNVVTAPVGSMYLNVGGSAGATLYIKESGSGKTGWVAK